MSFLGRSQSEPFFNLTSLVVGTMTDFSLSGVLVGDSPKSMKFVLSVTTKLRTKFVLHQELMSALSSATVFCSITLLKMSVGCPCSGENQLMKVLNGWVFLTF